MNHEAPRFRSYFGQTPTPETASTTKEPIIVGSTVSTPILVDDNGRSCQCVPYYLCGDNNIGGDENNEEEDGEYKEVDVRFGEEDERLCKYSVEVCCTVSTEPVKPKPTEPVKKPIIKGCGYRNPNGVGITFTHAATQFGEFPWVVALLDSKTFVYIGVGVLINPEVVMTAAHIISEYGPFSLKIRAGEWDTQTELEKYEFQERLVKELYIHNKFNKRFLLNDIALLRLEKPLELSRHINVICMPKQDEVFDTYKNCIANGWGKDTFGVKGKFAVILKKVEVNMVPYNRCRTLLRRTRLGSNFKLPISILCAGGEEGKDTCQGDGGAPLVCPIGNNQYKLTGLVAGGIGCGDKDVPALYVNVPMFREWVDKKMEEWGLLLDTNT
ncbi:unnamed protein product [Arctia plantaginis]|uniref:Phenoloxidase-activating factor 2 n=1 Tax=Arctia plantaginis TaxID=874455 RepID=A0A8S1BQ49_ARCPL|nr:unnamed protein product [Arctia plantaginis]